MQYLITSLMFALSFAATLYTHAADNPLPEVSDNMDESPPANSNVISQANFEQLPEEILFQIAQSILESPHSLQDVLALATLNRQMYRIVQPYLAELRILPADFFGRPVQSQLYLIVQYGCIHRLRDLLQGGQVDINAVDDQQRTPLMMAARALPSTPRPTYDDRQAQIIDILLEAGANMYMEDDFGDNAFMYAVQSNYVQVMQTLLRWEASLEPSVRANTIALLDSRDGFGQTALMQAARHNHIRAIELLCKLGANIYTRCGWNHTAFFHAITCGHTQAAIALLQQEAHLDPLTRARHTPLFEDVDDEQEGNPILIMAVVLGNVELVELLLVAGADINIENDEDQTPLTEAVTIVRMLDHQRRLPQLGAALAMVEMLLLRGADIYSDASVARTLLFHAIQNNHIQIAAALLHQESLQYPMAAQGHPPLQEVTNDQGTTALMLALKQRNLPMIRLLINHGHLPSTIQRARVLCNHLYNYRYAGLVLASMLLAEHFLSSNPR